MYSIYFDANGALAAKAGYFTFSEEAPTAYIYWNAATGACPYFGDERHGVVLDWQTHEYLHRTRGAALASGFGASGYTLGGNGTSNAHAQLTLEGGTFFDEDMKIIVTATNTPTAGTWEQDLLSPARIPVLYLSGTGWVIDAPTDYPLKQGTARPQYNALSGGVWSTADVANNKYATSWILATNNLTYPVIAIIGQAESDLQSAAEAVDFTSLQLPGFPSVEFRPLYRLVFQCADSFSNAVKASLVSITDIRSIAAAGVAASLITDHGNLSGLSDDDHPQYLSVDTVRTSLTAAVKASFLPSQAGNAGKFLTTDATSTSWAALTSGNITTALGFTPYNATNPAGYITGITSSDVTTALGFTPYNATNPSGFVTAAGARGAISVTGAGSYDSATGVINIVGGVTSFNTRTGAITLSSADVTTALGFTPYNSTNPNGYLTGITSTQVTTALGYTPYNSSNPSGYITGITSGMVTTALGFTPYNNSNPSGYITSSALSGYLTSASAASTYLPLAGGNLIGRISWGASLPNAKRIIGIYETGNLWTGIGMASTSASPIIAGDTNVSTLLDIGYYSLDGAYTWTSSAQVTKTGITFGGNTVLHAGNYNSYSPTLTGGGASGTWGISISGTAYYSNTMTSAYAGDVGSMNGQGLGRAYNYSTVGAWTGTPSGMSYGSVYNFGGQPDSASVLSLQIAADINHNSTNSTKQLWFRTGNNLGFQNDWKEVIHSGNYNSYAPTLTGTGASGTWGINVTGNAATATTATTATTASNSNNLGNKPAQDAVGANTIPTRDGNGYSYFNYINSNTGNSENAPVVQVITTQGSDNFYRKSSIAHFTSAVQSNASGTWGISISGNAATATALSSGQSNWVGTGVINNVVGLLAWKNYSNSHVIFDASAGTTPSGGAVSNTNAANAWSPTLPTLMGWNGSTSYGVRVDSARISDSTSGSSTSVSATTATGIQTNYVAAINTTTPGLATYGIAFSGSSSTDNAQGITWGWSGTNAQAGIYVQSSGSYGTKMYFGTTDSFATGSKTSMSIDHVGNVNLPRGTFSNGSIWINNGTNSNNYNENIRLFNAPNSASVIAFGASGISGTPNTSILGFSNYWEVRVSDSWQQRSYNGYVEAAGSFRAPIFYDSNDTARYIDPTAATSAVFSGSVDARTHYYAGVLVNSSGTGSAGSSIAIQQVTAEGWTGLFVDYEPNAGWGLYHDNPNNYFCVTAETSAGNFRSFTVPSRFSGNRTAYEKIRFDQNNGDIISGNIAYAYSSMRSPIFYDYNDTSYYLDPNSSISAILAGSIGIGTNSPVNSAWGDASGTKQITVYGSNYGVVNIRGNAGAGAWYSMGVGDGRFYAAYDNVTAIHRLVFYGNNTGINYGSSPAYNLHLGGTGLATEDWRAPIFYDSNNTSFFVNPDSTSHLVNLTIGYTGNPYAYAAASIGKLYFGSSVADSPDNYYIGTNMQNYGGNYTKLDIRWYTGQRFYAHSAYGGFRFHEITTGTQIFSINEGGSFALANQSMRAPIFYDSDNTTYYCDPNAMSNLWELQLTGPSHKYLYLNPGNGYEAMVRYNGGSGSGWYVGKRVSVDLVGTANFHFYSEAAGRTVAGIDTSGNFLAFGNVTAYSDERLKTNWRNMPADYVTRLAQVKVGIYDRAGQENVTQVGVSAQSFQKLLPQAVMTAEDEMQTLSVAYGNAALASAVELAKEVVDLRNRVAQLESLINKLIGD
jgi:hypothetical protein